VDKAEALRAAMLTVRGTPGFETPYHWAPYVLHGDWH
jgi:CHAT domain-containing protein